MDIKDKMYQKIFCKEVIREYSQVPSLPSLRTTQHCIQLIKNVRHLSFFLEMKDNEESYELCRNITMLKFQNQQFIFKQNDEGDAMFIILQGKVRFQKDANDQQANSLKNNELIQQANQSKNDQILLSQENTNKTEEILLGIGDRFGETSIYHKTKRSFCALAADETKDTILLCLNRAVYQKYKNSIQTFNIKRLYDLFLGYPGFQTLSKPQIQHLVEIANIKKYCANTFIFKQGQKIDYLYFVQTGRTKAIYECNNVQNVQQIKKFGAKTQTPIYLEIKEYNAGDCIEHKNIFIGDPIPFSLLSTMNCEMIMIGVQDINYIFQSEDMAILKVCTDPFPSEADFRYYYNEKLRWDQFKKGELNVIKNLHNQKIISEQQLLFTNDNGRKPITIIKDVPIPNILMNLKVPELLNFYVNELEQQGKQKILQDTLNDSEFNVEYQNKPITDQQYYYLENNFPAIKIKQQITRRQIQNVNLKL